MIGKSLVAVALLLAAAAPAPAQEAPAGVEVTTPGPEGPLAGTLLDPDPKAPLLLIVPGSGPTDRDGNNRFGVAGGPYLALAEALAKRGVATLRIDKRGMFGSRAAVADGNRVTITAYAADVRNWVDAMRKRTGRACIWLGGHSEGGLVVLVAAQQADGVCGVVLISAAGRPLAAIMREQFRANPANAPLLEPLLSLVDTLEAGKHADTAAMPAPLPVLFPDSVQDFMIDMFRYDPPKLATALKVPLLVTQGDRDVQIGVGDAQALAGASAGAKLVVVPGMTHVLRLASADDRAASLATYGNAALPVAPALVDAIAGFVTAGR
jgi:pimeloyl-ACP methyl ester carboxylesterase